MNNIVTLAQISLAVIQYFVAAALVGGAAFSAWTAKKSKLLTVPAALPYSVLVPKRSRNPTAFAPIKSQICSSERL
jgi:hypothetical protein